MRNRRALRQICVLFAPAMHPHSHVDTAVLDDMRNRAQERIKGWRRVDEFLIGPMRRASLISFDLCYVSTFFFFLPTWPVIDDVDEVVESDLLKVI